MIDIKTRKELGFDKDEFDGFVVRKDYASILQLHLYREFYTVFWLGNTVASKLWRCLGEITTELRDRRGLRVNSGEARYVTGAEFRRFQFVLEPVTELDKRISEAHIEFLNAEESSIGFARYDINSETPIILWSDLIVGEQTEIGFSSRSVLPDVVTRFIGETSIAKLGSDELQKISVGLADWIR